MPAASSECGGGSPWTGGGRFGGSLCTEQNGPAPQGSWVSDILPSTRLVAKKVEMARVPVEGENGRRSEWGIAICCDSPSRRGHTCWVNISRGSQVFAQLMPAISGPTRRGPANPGAPECCSRWPDWAWALPGHHHAHTACASRRGSSSVSSRPRRGFRRCNVFLHLCFVSLPAKGRLRSVVVFFAFLRKEGFGAVYIASCRQHVYFRPQAKAVAQAYISKK